MRALGNLIGVLVLLAGVFLAAPSFAKIASGEAGAGGPLMIGVILTGFGFYVCRLAVGKKCPSCAESVKTEALKCRHCGHEFPPAGPWWRMLRR